MELQQLRGFYEVAREGSFTRAADRLFVTQPAVSQQVKALEEELGERLLERGRGRLRLTPAGQILLERARSIFGELEAAREEIESLRQVVRGRVVVATSDTNCTYVLPEVLAEFRRACPEVAVEVRNKMSTEVGQLVLDDRADFGLATLPVSHRRLRAEPLFSREDVLICGAGHPLAGRRRVRLSHLEGEPLLLLEQGSRSRAALDEALRRAEVSAQVAMELGSIEVIKRFVEAGFGAAVVPGVSAAQEREAGRLAAVPIQGLDKRHVGLVWHRGRRQSAAARALADRVRHHLQGKDL